MRTAGYAYRKQQTTIRLIAALGLAGVCGCGALPGDASGTNLTADSQVVPDELIVAARAGASVQDVTAAAQAAGATIRDRDADLDLYLLRINPAQRDAAITTLTASALVEDVADNSYYDAQLTPRDTAYASQWYLSTIRAPEAWNITTGDENLVVAVVDSGIDASQPDLADRLIEGFNAYDNTNDTSDGFGHGTSVAGIIGAETDNRSGVAGLLWSGSILPIRVTANDGRTTSWTLAAAIREAMARGAKVINISFAPLYKDRLILRYCQLAWLSGSLVVISAGNVNERVDDARNPYALFIGAVGDNLTRASFSTYGDFVDLVAPGVRIVTTRKGGSYGAASGTSFAAPIVSGVAGLVWSVNPALRPSSVISILKSTARDLGASGSDEQYGAGLVDARAAVELAQRIVEADDELNPGVAFVSPGDTSTLRYPTDVEVWASDNFAVAEVLLSVDDQPLASELLAPYEFYLDPTRYGTGEHTMTATAIDTSGNRAATSITFTVPTSDSGGPNVSLSRPRNGDTVRGVVTVLGIASDDHGLNRAEILLDGTVIATIPLLSEPESTIAYNWNTSTAATGSHQLGVRVVDVNERSQMVQVRVAVAR